MHACWDSSLVEVPGTFRKGHRIDAEFLVEGSRKGSVLHRAIETTLKGPELPLAEGAIRDKDGTLRSKIRIRWWLEIQSRTFREVALGYDGETLQHMPERLIPAEFHSLFLPYSSDQKSVFIGHYWLSGSRPERLAHNIGCLDYSVAKGGPLVAYRWDGEQEIDNSKFVTE